MVQPWTPVDRSPPLLAAFTNHDKSNGILAFASIKGWACQLHPVTGKERGDVRNLTGPLDDAGEEFLGVTRWNQLEMDSGRLVTHISERMDSAHRHGSGSTGSDLQGLTANLKSQGAFDDVEDLQLAPMRVPRRAAPRLDDFLKNGDTPIRVPTGDKAFDVHFFHLLVSS